MLNINKNCDVIEKQTAVFVSLTCTFFDLIKCSFSLFLLLLPFVLKQSKWSHNAGVVPETIAAHSHQVQVSHLFFFFYHIFN